MQLTLPGIASEQQQDLCQALPCCLLRGSSQLALQVQPQLVNLQQQLQVWVMPARCPPLP